MYVYIYIYCYIYRNKPGYVWQTNIYAPYLSSRVKHRARVRWHADGARARRTRARPHARAHTRTHTHRHTGTHTRTHTHKHTHTQQAILLSRAVPFGGRVGFATWACAKIEGRQVFLFSAKTVRGALSKRHPALNESGDVSHAFTHGFPAATV